MRKLFISDLHLNPAQSELTLLVSHFLQDQADKIDEIYFLGDIFDTWLGDDLVPDEFNPFTEILYRLSTAGIKIYLMVGNRDFMLGKQFARSVNASLLCDPHKTVIADRPCLLMHGDSLCIDDANYQCYRKWVRNRFLQWCFVRLSRTFRQRISNAIKQQSREQKQSKSTMIMDVNQAEVVRIMQQYRVELLIHGHTHRPAIHSLAGNKLRIVLGDWQNKPSFLMADDQILVLRDHRLNNESTEQIVKLPKTS